MGAVVLGLPVVVAVLFMATGGVKVIGLEQSLRIRDHFGLAPNVWRAVGALESAGGVGVLIGIAVPPLGVASAVGLGALMVGALVSRFRVRDPAWLIALDVAVLVLVVITAIGRAFA